MAKRVCYLWLIFILLLHFSAAGQVRVVSEFYSTEDGLSQNSILDIKKGPAGFLWFATKDGLSRFDGYNFRNFKARNNDLNSSVSNHITSITIAKDSSIWLLNNMGQALRFDAKTEQFDIYPSQEYNRGDNFVFIKQILFARNGDIWLVGSGNGAIRVRRNAGGHSEERLFCSKLQDRVGNDVRSAFEDSEGCIWLLTENGVATVLENDTVPSRFYLQENGLGLNSLLCCAETNDELLITANEGRLFRYDKLKRRFSSLKLPTDGNLNGIALTSDSEALISSDKNGFFLLNLTTGNINNFCKAKNPELPSDFTEQLWRDARGDVWLKFRNTFGLVRFDAKSQEVQHLPFQFQDGIDAYNEEEFCFSFKDDNDQLWLLPADKGKCAWYDKRYEGEKPRFEKEDQKDGLPSVIYKTLRDSCGVFWSATSYNGVQKLVSSNESFVLHKCKKAAKYAEANDVRSVYEDNVQNLWIATRDNCVRLYNKQRQTLGCLSSSGNIVSDAKFGTVHAIYQDRKGIVWLGSNAILYKLTPRNQNGTSFSLQAFHLEENGMSAKALKVTDVLEDSRGRIWIATSGDGLQMLDEKKENGSLFINRHNLLKFGYPPSILQTNCLFEDASGNIWLGSNEGITVFPAEFEDFRFLKFFFYNPENTNLENSYISDIYQDKNGKMWFASFGGGLFRTENEFFLGETPEFKTFSKSNNLFPTDLIYSVQEDCNGFIWCVSENMIIKHDPKKQTSETFGTMNGLNSHGFSEHAFALLKGNKFAVGTNSGFYLFSPDKIVRNDFVPRLQFTKFLLFNKEVEVCDNSVLKQPIHLINEIELNHDQNIFAIEYAALDFSNSHNVQYAYKLDGFEDNWNMVGTQRVASFTNLPHGKYRLLVKSTNSEGFWCDNTRSISITIKPSFWETGWAYLLYLLLFLLVVGGALTGLLLFFRLRSQMQFDKEMSSVKLQFFTDVSHELRTPLTLINAPLENVLNNGKLNENDRKQLEVVRTNAQRMLRMMNQILDFRKLQSNKMRLKVEECVIGELLVKCCSNFTKLADSRKIDFVISDNTNGARYWVDRDKFDTIVFNLLSNAFKFTPEKKRIEITLNIEDGNCALHVKDQGCGIQKDKLGVIFDRYTTLQTNSLTKQSGTGIGLSLVKEIADLHKAEISVSSEVNVGSEFIIRLKPGTEHFDENADIIRNAASEQTATELVSAENDNQKMKLLVVEDNEELRSFIVSVLSAKYNVIDAPDGEAGLASTLQEMPDFILTDIMMPKLDGIELTRRIRQNERTSHIPIILLTAKTDMDSKLECLRIGANDYLTKPFSMVYLETRIENIIAERKKWQNSYRGSLVAVFGDNDKESAETNEAVLQKPEAMDDAFMKKFVDFIEQNMEQSELSLDDICDALKISRWNMTSKVKSLVGMTPVEFIREIRLAKAAKLIMDGELNMTQITYMIGMTDSRYFSRCFKQKFGMTPTEYKHQNSNQ